MKSKRGEYLRTPQRSIGGIDGCPKAKPKGGDRFHPYHGLTYREESKHKDIYVVVGLLKPTGTPTDRVIWIPIKGFK